MTPAPDVAPGSATSTGAPGAPGARGTPWRRAVLVTVAYGLPLALWLLLPWDAGTRSAGGWVVLIGVDLTRVAVACVLLSVGGWWRSGIWTRPTWRGCVPAVPLLAVCLAPLLLGPGLADAAPWRFAVVAVGVATVAFAEEAVFRGVVLHGLLAAGATRAVVGSSVLFGLMHVINLAGGGHPVTVAAQVVMATGLGIGFGAVALAGGTIWPLVVVHGVLDLTNAVQAAAPVVTVPVVAAAAPMTDLLLGAAADVVLGAVVAVYGLWLLHRRAGLLRDLPGH